MAKRRVISVKARQASRRNVIRAQQARVGKKEPRSVGRETRKRQRYSKPQSSISVPTRIKERSRTRTRSIVW